MKVSIRPAEVEDVGIVHNLILELAIFEKAPKEVEVSIDQLNDDIFGSNSIIEVYVAEYEGEIAGVAIVYEKYSTWKGRSMHLEDLIVNESFRGKGIGTALFEFIIDLSVKRNYGRMEWQVLDWNESAIEFYKNYGSEFLEEWLDCRLTKQDLNRIAK